MECTAAERHKGDSNNSDTFTKKKSKRGKYDLQVYILKSVFGALQMNSGQSSVLMLLSILLNLKSICLMYITHILNP